MATGSGHPIPAAGLVGRQGVLDLLHTFVDHCATVGGALLLSGEAGVGKTALLEAASDYATGVGLRVLAASGAEFESAVSFSGLHQVLYPLFDRLPELDGSLRRTLGVALGLRDGPRPDTLAVASAAQALLVRGAGDRAALVVVDDLPWLDRASAVVLGLIARRLAGARIGFLAASRTGEGSFFDRGVLPEHEIGPLDDAAAAALVRDRFPSMTTAVRRRLLSEARGNPLALLELPVALTSDQRAGTGPLPELLPLSRRLQEVFELRVADLPARTRHVLLLAVLEGTGSLEVLQAASQGRSGRDLAPAERARLVSIDEDRGVVVFRHPLTRSAVVELSTGDQRRRVHRALAAQLRDQPERHAWHRARAAVGPDEEIAALLEQVAGGIRQRGDAAGAVAALLRAAELSPAGADRSRRLAEAAYFGAVSTGDLRSVPRLLQDARRAHGEHAGSLVMAVAAAHHLLLSGEGDIDTAHRLLVGAIEMWPGPYDAADDTVSEALNTLGWVCYFGGRTELWEPFHRALDLLVPQAPEAIALLEDTFADPARTALLALGRLDAAVAALDRQADPIRAARISLACIFVDRLADCRARLWRIRHEAQEGGAVTLSLHALSLLGLDSFMVGEWDEAGRLADEHVELCRSHDYQLLECLGLYLHAMLAAARGDDATTTALTDRMTRWAQPRHSALVVRLAAQARMLAALGRGGFEEAYRHAEVVSPAGELASHVPHALWLIMDLTEAAVRTGRGTEARAHVAAARAAGVAAISPRYAMLVSAAAGMAAEDGEGLTLFEEALAVPGVERWPFDLARVQLAHGERLRRAKATTQARVQLAAALESFHRLGARPWVQRAGHELRATGITVGSGADSGPASLTPQQREIVGLAAAGLTNKQIGERLFLSPRTVSTHLYQAFPKLGVTSRAGLRDALRANG
jgi:DNA-binding CsgD family transcriptional regulator